MEFKVELANMEAINASYRFVWGVPLWLSVEAVLFAHYPVTANCFERLDGNRDHGSFESYQEDLPVFIHKTVNNPMTG